MDIKEEIEKILYDLEVIKQETIDEENKSNDITYEQGVLWGRIDGLDLAITKLYDLKERLWISDERRTIMKRLPKCEECKKIAKEQHRIHMLSESYMYQLLRQNCTHAKEEKWYESSAFVYIL